MLRVRVEDAGAEPVDDEPRLAADPFGRLDRTLPLAVPQVGDR